MKIVYDIKNGDYIESESGERVQLYYPFDKKAIIKAWEFGLEEAWEAARKLAVDTEYGGMSNKSIKEAFGGIYFDDVFKLFTAKEAIQKIKEYEKNKAEKDERIEYLKHEDIKKDGKTVRVWNGGTDSRCRIREEEKGHFLKKALEETKDSYKKMIEEAISETFERMNENKSEKEKEKKMKSGDKFIIELGKGIKIQRETSVGEWEIDEAYEVKGTGAVISAKDLMNLKEYKEQKNDEEIKVGDEIISKCNNKAVVIHIDSWGKWHCLTENGFFTVDNERIYWKKTGKHYDEVEKIFQKLKESEKEDTEIPFM